MKNKDEFVSPAGRRVRYVRTWPAFVFLFIGIVVTVVGWRLSRESIDAKLDASFNAETSRVITKLETAFQQQGDVLRSLQGLYAQNVEVVRDVFELFATVPKGMYPGIESISYAPLVRAADKAVFLDYARNEGYANFALKPEGDRDFYMPIEHLVPMNGNEDQSGQDLLQLEAVRPAVERARDENAIASSDVYMPEGHPEPVVLLITPIYSNGRPIVTVDERRAAFRGVCLIRLHAQTFVTSALSSLRDSLQIAISIASTSQSAQTQSIYRQSPDASPIRSSREPFYLAGTEWTLDFSTRASFARAINVNLPWLVAGAGAVISILLFAFTFSFLTSRDRAVDLAERITRSQRRIVDSSQNMIGMLDTDGRWTSMNLAARRILGTRPDDFIGIDHRSFIFPADRDFVLKSLSETADETPVSFEARYLHADGSVRWIHWNVTPSSRDGRVYMIGMDVTEQRLAAELLRVKNYQLDVASAIADRENALKEQSIREQSRGFRTHLTNISGFVHLILESPDMEADELKSYLAIVERNAGQLLQSVQDLVEVSVVRTHDIAFDVASVPLADLLTAIRAEVAQKELPLTIPDEANIDASCRLSLDSSKMVDVVCKMAATVASLAPDATMQLGVAPKREAEQCIFTLHIQAENEIPASIAEALAEDYALHAHLTDPGFFLALGRLSLHAMGCSLDVMHGKNECTLIIAAPLAV